MTIHQPIHQCPKCELRFSWQTELDDHCRDEHPGFKHAYPAHDAMPERAAPPDAVEAARASAVRRAAARRASESHRTSDIVATWWSER